MKFGVVVFPGSNCDYDAFHVLDKIAGQPVVSLVARQRRSRGLRRHHRARRVRLRRLSAYRGDREVLASDGRRWDGSRREADWSWGYATASRSYARRGCCPERLCATPGSKYICRPVHLRVESTATPFTSACAPAEVLEIPIGHMEGNYVCDDETLRTLERNERVVFRYCDEQGQVTAEANPEWLAGQHRGHLQRGPQRDGNDAASGPLRGSASGIERRMEDLRRHDRGPAVRSLQAPHSF